MKTTNLGMVALTLLGASAVTSYAQATLDLNLSPLSGSQIVFSGSSFNFSAASPGTGIGPGGLVPDQWSISSEGGSAATGSAMNHTGGFAGGPFNYGPITTTPIPGGGSSQDASVLNPGMLYIADGTGFLQGTINFIDISTVNQSGGLINSSVLINLLNVSYGGANQDLQFLTANQPGTVDLSFQFASGGLNLTQLSDGNMHSTSYSGTISAVAVPEPSSLAMSALGGLGALGFAFRKRYNI
jgi:hypothetical protein